MWPGSKRSRSGKRDPGTDARQLDLPDSTSNSWMSFAAVATTSVSPAGENVSATTGEPETPSEGSGSTACVRSASRLYTHTQLPRAALENGPVASAATATASHCLRVPDGCVSWFATRFATYHCTALDAPVCTDTHARHRRQRDAVRAARRANAVERQVAAKHVRGVARLQGDEVHWPGKRSQHQVGAVCGESLTAMIDAASADAHVTIKPGGAAKRAHQVLRGGHGGGQCTLGHADLPAGRRAQSEDMRRQSVRCCHKAAVGSDGAAQPVSLGANVDPRQVRGRSCQL